MKWARSLALFSAGLLLAGCGVYTPSKDLLRSEAIDKSDGSTERGNYENSLVNHIVCEVGHGLRNADKYLKSPWIRKWGTTITQSITAEDQSGVAPGISAINPLQNAVVPFSNGPVTLGQSFSFSAGGTASANALRTETIQYTFRNEDIIKYAPTDCHNLNGVFIDGNLKISEFIYDKAVIGSSGDASLYTNGKAGGIRPPFNVFTEEITFVAAFGGTATPTWKLARISANTSSNLLVAQRTVTDDLVVTLGPIGDLKKLKSDVPLELTASAMNQHLSRVQAAAIAVSVLGQSH